MSVNTYAHCVYIYVCVFVCMYYIGNIYGRYTRDMSPRARRVIIIIIQQGLQSGNATAAKNAI